MQTNYENKDKARTPLPDDEADGWVRITHAGPGGWEIIMGGTRHCRTTLIEALADAETYLLKISREATEP